MPPLPQTKSERPIAFDRNSAARAGLRVIVPECLVLDAAVVPEGDRMLLPAEADLEFLARAVLAQKLEDRAALVSRQPVDMGGEMSVDEQRLALGHGMGANDWMRRRGEDLVTVVAA